MEISNGCVIISTPHGIFILNLEKTMKKLMLMVVLCSLCAIGFAQTTESPTPAPAVKFSLEEERYVTAFNKEGLAKFETAILEVSGAKVTLEVDFNSFAGKFDSMKYIEGSWSTDVIIGVVKEICVDEIGKRRFAEAVKKIVIRHRDEAKSDDITLENGTLTILTHLSSSGISSSSLSELLQKSI
jgi:hypothetical protein